MGYDDWDRDREWRAAAEPARCSLAGAAPEGAASVLARLDLTRETLRRGDGFRRRVAEAAGDMARLADLLAEAVDWALTAPAGREQQGWTLAMAETEASYCLHVVRAAYAAAKLAAMAEAAAR